MHIYTSIIDNNASKYNVDPTWIEAIITQESNWDCFALRYEANYPYLFEIEKFAKNLVISFPTEMMTQRMSWGLGQIMGALAREQGHKGAMGELFLPNINIQHMCIRIKDLKKRSEHMDDIFAMYNGGPGAMRKKEGKYSNQLYVDNVKRHLQTYLKG